MILCCGESLIDLIPEEEGSEKRVPHVGGAVLNTAVALGRLGEEVGLLTGISSDEYGVQIETFACESKVDLEPAVRSDRPTTLAIVTLTNGQASYEFRDEGSATRMISVADLPDGVAPDALVFGGISLINAPVADTFADFCVSQSDKAAIMLDVNIRPGFIDDPETYRARIARMIAATDILKVSDEDIAWLLPNAEDEADALAEFGKAGPKFVVITKGAEGAVGRLASGATVEVPTPPTKVADTVGAGDTFNAGLLAGLRRAGLLTRYGIAGLSEDQAREALAFAALTASVTVSRSGANPPWAHELDAMET